MTKLGRSYVRTKHGRYLTADFDFEIVLTLKKDEGIAFVGLGEGVPSGPYKEPGDSLNFRIHCIGRYKGDVGLSKTGVGGEGVGKIKSEGPHRVRISKRGDTVTMAIDVDDDGPSPDDIERAIPNIREYAPFLHSKNTYLFFGGDGTFTEVVLSQ